ncbi:hypothetical protein V6Z12_D11G270400 [Gossypium hirsutum]
MIATLFKASVDGATAPITSFFRFIYRVAPTTNVAPYSSELMIGSSIVCYRPPLNFTK